MRDYLVRREARKPSAATIACETSGRFRKLITLLIAVILTELVELFVFAVLG